MIVLAACAPDRGPVEPTAPPDLSAVGAGDRPFYYYQHAPVYLDPDSSRVVVTLREGRTSESAGEVVQAVTGRAAEAGRRVAPGVHVFELAGQEPGKPSQLVSRLRDEGIASIAVPAYRWEGDGSDVFLTNRFMVQFSPGVSRAMVQALADSAGLAFVRTPAPDSGRFSYTFRYPDGTADPLAFVNQIAVRPDVEWATPDKVAGRRLVDLPTDPYFPLQFYLDNPLIYQGKHVDDNPDWAWFETRGAGVTVAIIDQGVQVSHPDFSFSGPIRVYDAVDGDTSAAVHPEGQLCGHGTSVAGIIFAEHNNGQGVAGIAPDAHVAVARIFDDFRSPTTDENIALAINWAWSIGDADVLNNSWGGGSPDDAITTAITLATILGRGGKGSLVVFAAGNYEPSVAYPASLGATVAVSAITRSGALAPYSPPTGMTVNDLVAPSSGEPGEQYGVVTTDVTGADGYTSGDYNFNFGGTSAAAPQVSGAAALVYVRYPTLLQATVRSRLTANADNWGSSAIFGAGKLNASPAAGVTELLAHVSGPSYILSKGSYTWTASRSGGIGTYAYRWRQRFVGGSWSVVGSGASVNLMVYGGDDDFDLELRVISGMQTKYDTLRVVNCINGGAECIPY